MRKLPLYIFTEDLNFFYRLNKALKEKNIPFKISNIPNKIPNFPSIILTTVKELDRLLRINNRAIILAYSLNEKFEDYLLKVIASYRVGFKNNYNSLIFSIDPGNRIGLMVFLDDYYFDSYCFYEEDSIIKNIHATINYFQINNPHLMNLEFKFGSGVLSITQKLIDMIYKTIENENKTRIFLIDEFKSSKIKTLNKYRQKKISKDEISALILALREGIELNFNNYLSIFNQTKRKKSKINSFHQNKSKTLNEPLYPMEEIIKKILNNEFSLSDASQLI
ncbi:MAG: hypothetical protein ACFFFB_06610 [Candidatus Heimdallarchaeota archaeon]